MTKLALCLHGKVGGEVGKHSQNEQSSENVLEIAYQFNKKNILDVYDTDVFIHSWSTELEQQIVDKYNPIRYCIEKQIDFEVPIYIKSTQARAFAHLSRWYSFAESVDMVNEYVDISKREEVDIVYDHVLVQRFDLLWNIIPDFKSMDSKYFWVGNSTLDTNKEWSDRWFSSNLENMTKFSKLWDKLPEYMTGDFPSYKQYGGISSHMLSKYHADKCGLNAKFKYMFGGYSQTPNDYNEVRRQIFKDDR